MFNQIKFRGGYNLKFISAMLFAVTFLVGGFFVGNTAQAETINISNLSPDWSTDVYSAYYANQSLEFKATPVSPGPTAVYEGLEAGSIKAGQGGLQWDEGLFGFKPNVTIDTLATTPGSLTYNVKNQYGNNPVWMTIEIDTGLTGENNRADNTTYQFVPTTDLAGWHTVLAGPTGQWQLMDDNGNGVGAIMSLAQVNALPANTGRNVVRVYLRLGMGPSYSSGSGTVAWVDKVTIGGVTYDFVLAGDGDDTIAINLEAADDFVIVAKTLISDATPAGSAITGNIAIDPAAGSFITGLSCTNVLGGGKIYNDGGYTGGHDANVTCEVVAPTTALAARSAMEAAYTDAAGRTATSAATTNVGAGTLTNLTLAPGVYEWNTNVTIPTDLTLNGNETDVWIFQIAGDLSIASAMKVKLIGGALAKNVFWQVGGPTGATLGTTSTFNGTILSATKVILQTGATLNGRALAQTAVTLDGNTVMNPSASTPIIHKADFAAFDGVDTATNSYTLSSGITATYDKGTGTLSDPVLLKLTGYAPIVTPWFNDPNWAPHNWVTIGIKLPTGFTGTSVFDAGVMRYDNLTIYPDGYYSMGTGSTDLATAGAASGYLDYSFAADSTNTTEDGLVKLKVIWTDGGTPEYYTIDVTGLQLGPDSLSPTIVSSTINTVTKTIVYTLSEPIRFVSQANPLIITQNPAGLVKIYTAASYASHTLGQPEPNSFGGTNTATLNGNVLTINYTDTLPTDSYLVDTWGYTVTDLAGNQLSESTVGIFTVNETAPVPTHGRSSGSRAVPAKVETPDGCATGNKFSTTTGRNCNAATPAGLAGQVLGASTQAGSVLGAEKFNFTKFLKFKAGSYKVSLQGAEVIELQKFLTSLGYDLGIADGKFGPKTKDAVIKFQIANKLVGDGVVGALTREALNK